MRAPQAAVASGADGRRRALLLLGLCPAMLAAVGGRAFAQVAGADGSTTLQEITVEGDGSGGGADARSNATIPLKTDGYVTKSSPTGSKTGTPPTELPQSVSTVTRQQLEDRNVQTLTAAVNYTAGVRTNTSGFDPRFDSFFVRGFDVTSGGLYRDGLREPGSGFAAFKTEPYGLDGVSILKGPASTLYGGGAPGGLIELTSKRPTFQPFGEVEAEIGNYDRRQGQFDVGGPVGDTFAYRVTGLVRDSDTFLPGTPDDKVFIAPAFTWKPNEDTTFTLLTEYSHVRTGANTAFYNDTSGPRPRVTRLFSGDPAFNKLDQDQGRIGYAFEHKFSPDVTFRQNFRYAHTEVDAEYIDILAFKPGATQANRFAGAIANRVDSVNVDNQIEAKTTTGPVAHTLLAGLDVQYVDFTEMDGSASTKDHPEWVPPIILDPLTYGGHIYSPNANDTNLRTRQRDLGFYAQDQMRIGQFLATLGFRNDWVDTDAQDRLAGGSTERNDSKLTGRAGLMYLGPLGINPYVNYATSFYSELGKNDLTGEPFKPTTGEQFEGGVKWAPPGYNATVTAAVFDITQRNVVRNFGVAQSIQTGEINAKGFELEANGSLDNGVSFTAAYTYLDQTIVVGSDKGTTGNRPSAIPEHAASLWANYAFRPGTALDGFSLGGGARYTGRSFGDDENTFRNKAFLLFDAVAKLEFDRFNPALKGVALQVNARNLTNKDIATCEQGYCYRDEGRTVVASLRYRW